MENHQWWPRDLLSVVSDGALVSPEATVIAVCKNEMYFLPAFLEHYRRLGATRFCILDDCSEDGSFDFLRRQKDVTLLKSPYSYGQNLVPDSGPLAGKEIRAMLAWRNALAAQFGLGRWTIQVDMDEFLVLPEGLSISGLFSRLDTTDSCAALGVMLDLYPQKIEPKRISDEFDPYSDWFYDGVPHLELQGSQSKPRQLYAGSRARLMRNFGVRYAGLSDQFRAIRKGNWPPMLNTLYKPVAVKWRDGDWYKSSHRVSAPLSDEVLLPILHYKFADSLRERAESAVAEGAHYQGSKGYALLAELLDRAERSGSTLLYRKSRPVSGFEDFVLTGNARVPDFNA